MNARLLFTEVQSTAARLSLKKKNRLTIASPNGTKGAHFGPGWSFGAFGHPATQSLNPPITHHFLYLEEKTMIQKSIFLFTCCLACFAAFGQQVADTAFTFPINKPMYPKGAGPVITLDEAHFNFHTLDGRYYTFGKLLESDGYVLRPGREPFNPASLSKTRILVIANALADNGPWRLPTRPAFTEQEAEAVQTWVKAGGRLFLIADHMPFPAAAAPIASVFGFNLINGFAMRRDNRPEYFTRQGENLTSNPITNGRNKSEQIDSIRFFTGQGFIAPKAATPICVLGPEYDVLLPTVAWEFGDTTAVISGRQLVNGAMMTYGKGRIVVMGEAAMFSAQLAGAQRQKMGMNAPDARQNPQFLLNIIHWLDEKL